VPEIFSRWVLVVDNAVSIRTLMSIYLEGAGYRVIQAEDGNNALAQLRAGYREWG
jgi:CheY-like chemotaxis protein